MDRDDNVINLCEMKFYAVPFTMDKKFASEVAKKVDAFSASTQTKKSIYTTFITTYGVTPNAYSRQHIQNELTMDHLFKEL